MNIDRMNSQEADVSRNRKSKLAFAIVPVLAIGAGALLMAPQGFGGQGDPECGGFPVDEVLNGGGDTEFVGTPKRDVVVGSEDSDHIRGKGGNDVLCGEESDDRINGGEGKDQLYGQEGNDTLRGRPDDDFMDGGFSPDKRGFEEDYCLGGKPFPDTKASFDEATNCEEVVSAFQVKGAG
jgi:RTX calcium-binding nonapeptide repeat (4 copies)